MTDRIGKREREALIAEGADALTLDATADLAALARLLAAPATWAEPRAGLEDAVVRAVASAEPADEEPERTLAVVVTPLHPDAPRRRGVRRVVGWATAAAVVAAITLVAGPLLLREEARPDFKASLRATALAPRAAAEAEMYHSNAGFRVTLDAHGLAALPAGEYYQAWLHDATGTFVPIGTFSSSDGHVTLWSGVSARHYPMVTVTVEPTDKQPAPSRRRVLTGVMQPI